MDPLLAIKKVWVPNLKEVRFVETIHVQRLHGTTKEAIASRVEKAGFSLSVMHSNAGAADDSCLHRRSKVCRIGQFLKTHLCEFATLVKPLVAMEF